MIRVMNIISFLLVFSSLVSVAVAEEAAVIAPSVSVAAPIDAVTLRQDANTQKTIIQRQDIENMGAMTISEVLNKLPGVEISGSGQRARGMSRDSIQILIDGERQSISGMAALSRLPSSELVSVEINRGASAEFGGSSPLTINLVLNKARAKQPDQLKLGFGFKGDEPNAQISWTQNGSDGNFSWSLPVTLNFSRAELRSSVLKRGDVIRTDTGFDDGAQNENLTGISKMGHHGFMPSFSWKSGRDSLSVAPMVFFGPSERQTNTRLLSARIDDDWTSNGFRLSEEEGFSRYLRLRVNGEKFFGESKLSGRVSYNSRLNTSDNKRAIFSSDGFTQQRFSESSKSDDDEWNTALRWDHPVGLHYVSMAIELDDLKRRDQQRFAGFLPGSGSFDSATQNKVLWIQDAWNLDQHWTMTSGLRYEDVILSSNAVSQAASRFLPSVAIKWQPNDAWVLRSSLGAGMKMPKINEISAATTRSFDLNTPLDPDQRGNPNLKPEKSINFEAAIERYLPNQAGVFSANAYVRKTQDFTERRVELLAISDTTFRWIDRPYNEGDSLHWGLELDGKMNTDHWAWSGGTIRSHLTLPEARVDDTRLGKKRMARDTPHYIWSFGFDQKLPALQSSFGMNLQLSGRSETVIPNEQSAFMRSRALLDAYWLVRLNAKMNLRISGQNLLGEDVVRSNRFRNGSSNWQYNSDEYAFKTFMVFIEANL